jgi:hypothetical protein
MTHETSKEFARACLAAQGFTVEDILPVSHERRADLRARWNEEEYVIEAKGREETEGW